MWLRVLTCRKVAIYSDGDIIIYSFKSFSPQRLLMVSHWSFSDYKSPVVVGLSWFCWYYFGCVGISFVVIPSLNVDGK